MITSRLTSKAQTTIPQAVRVALGLREGDEIAYVLDGATVTIRKAPRPGNQTEDPFGAFSEWSGEADTRAYGEL